MIAQPRAFLNNVAFYIHALRRAGLPVSTKQSMDFVRGLSLIDMSNREQFYSTALCMLLTNHEHIDLFQAIFNRFWGQKRADQTHKPQKAPRAPRHREQHQPFMISYMATKSKQADPEVEVSDRSFTYSASEKLQIKDFSQMTPDELNAIKQLIQNIRWKISLRQTRRRFPANKGNRLYLRRILASSVQSGGVPLRLFWESRKLKPRPVILLADISGSMEKYSRLALQFFYSMSQTHKHLECFVFGTRLTRITPHLSLKNIDRAIDTAARQVVDWAGGTRIGESLQQFNQIWSRRVLRRGAIILIISDGWERGDIQLLRESMRYIQLRSYHVAWLNPLSGKVGYQPKVDGMAAALPYIDSFLPCHNLQSLETFAEQLGKIGTIQ